MEGVDAAIPRLVVRLFFLSFSLVTVNSAASGEASYLSSVKFSSATIYQPFLERRKERERALVRTSAELLGGEGDPREEGFFTNDVASKHDIRRRESPRGIFARVTRVSPPFIQISGASTLSHEFFIGIRDSFLSFPRFNHFGIILVSPNCFYTCKIGVIIYIYSNSMDTVDKSDIIRDVSIGVVPKWLTINNELYENILFLVDKRFDDNDAWMLAGVAQRISPTRRKDLIVRLC